MSKTRKVSISKRKEILGIIIISLVGIGSIATILAVKQNTGLQQHASTFQDLNSADQITDTNNPDGTMGPVDYTQNFSNTLPTAYLGTLNVQITDPPQGAKPTDLGNSDHDKKNDMPDSSHPSSPSGQGDNDNSNNQGNGGGPQTVTSLLLTITKVEVHLAQIGLPGSRNEDQGKPTGTPAPKTNRDVDKWEVLKINAPQTIDLIQLANAKTLASLGITQLANGRYTEIRLYVSTASATLQDGTKVSLTIPGRASIVRIVEPFVINAGKTTTLKLDFDAQNSVIKAGNGYILKPVVAHLLENDQQ